MKKHISVTLFFIFVLVSADAQLNRYLIQFADKNNTPYSLQRPSEYLSEKSINRRIRYQIPIDSLDLPVNSNYIESVRATGNVSILNASKWLNSISIQTTDLNVLASIQSLPFVREVKAIASRNTINPFNKFLYQTSSFLSNTQQRSGNYYSYGLSEPQIQMHRAPFLHNLGFRGDSVHIAIIDAGFYKYDQFTTFDSVRTNGQIADTWDFVKGESTVSEDDAHGMQCFSTMAANLPGTFVGSSPKANFYLYRSEDVFSEYPIEEHNLACAAERADSAGVDICSISLGYSTFTETSLNYTYNDMNGNICISSRAVQMGSNKGMLFVLAAGNEGNSSWYHITAPADAKDALTVGAVNGAGTPASFSSYGPSFDGRIKPNVASFGSNSTIANTTDGQPTFGSGTSFACPNMAGVAACLWQAFKEKNNSEIINALQNASNNFATPNDRIGFGIPDIRNAFISLHKSGFTHTEEFHSCRAEINGSLKTNSSMHFIVERKYPDEINYTQVSYLTNDAAWGFHHFSLTDDLQNNTSQVNYRYSIKINNDTTYYIDSATLYFLNPCTPMPPVVSKLNEIILTPNPAHNTIYAFFSLGKEISANWNIYNSKGQLIQTKQTSIPAEGSSISFDLSNFSTGLYFIKLMTNENEIYTARFVKW